MRNKAILFIYVLLVIIITSSSAAVTPQVSAGRNHTVGLKTDGTVVAVGKNSNGHCNVSDWSGITQVSVGVYHTVGLKSDGTLVAAGYDTYGQCNVSSWSEITQVACGVHHTVGLKSDGTVVADGRNWGGQCDVRGWSGITQVSGGGYHTVGLKTDGTVVAVGDNTYGKCNVSSWSGITQVSAGWHHTVGLKSDGTLVVVGLHYSGSIVSGWDNITQVSDGYYHTVGLKSDGTVVAVGKNWYGQCHVSGWNNITQVSAGYYHTVGLKSDGTVVVVGRNYFGQCDVRGWNLGSASTESIRIVSWNILNYPESNEESREEYFRRVIESLSPDILVVQEMASFTGLDRFLEDVLKPISKNYSAAKFFDGPDTDNALFYDKSKFKLQSRQQIPTSFRDIVEYSIKIKKGPGKGSELNIYSVHFKEGLSAGNKSKRENEANILRSYLNGLPLNDLYLVCGTFNMTESNEKAYKILTDAQIDNIGRLKDPLDQPGKWHHFKRLKNIHTESTRKAKYGDGASGGLNDRYDMILISYSLDQNSALTFRPGSCVVYGNDGQHLNKAINWPKNRYVSPTMAEALYKASDHLPVIIELKSKRP